mmetsp:Transcript_18759/g.47700  ORF Transcript_18759/g.47700 Transcript_18759/m.47700 type:complete len:633 (-) Transcript_18759:269-2167(-)
MTSFWRTFGLQNSPINQILESGDFTIESLLNENGVLAETKQQNKRLVEFLAAPENITKMIDYIFYPPPEDADDKRKTYPTLCTDILSCETFSISEALCTNENLERLFSFVDLPLDSTWSLPTLEGSGSVVLDKDAVSSLNDNLCKIATSLLVRMPTESIKFIKTKDDAVDKLLVKLSNTPTKDFLLKLILVSRIPGNPPVMEWLSEKDMLPKLVDVFAAYPNRETHENITHTMIDIINVCTSPPALPPQPTFQTMMSGLNLGGGMGMPAPSQTKAVFTTAAPPPSSPLLDLFQSKPIVEKIVSSVLRDATAVDYHILQDGLELLISLMGLANAAPGSREAPLESLPIIHHEVYHHLHTLPSLLRSNGEGPQMRLSHYLVNPPFGFTRLKLVEFVCTIMKSQFHVMQDQLNRHGVLKLSMELFFEYPWNNFLHSSVEQIFRSVYEESNQGLMIEAFKECRIGPLFREAGKKSSLPSDHGRAIHKGYVGHLMNIACAIQSAAAKHTGLRTALDADNDWKVFSENFYAETMAVQSRQLGGHKPLSLETGSSEDEDLELDETGESSDLVNVFTQYLVQQGFNADFPDDFNDDEDYEEEDDEINFDADNQFEEAYEDEKEDYGSGGEAAEDGDNAEE